MESSVLDEFRSRCAERLELPQEEIYLDEGQLRRFLIAREHNLDKAFELWEKWVDWRKSYRADMITEAEVAPIYETGKMFLRGHDRQNRPCLIIRTRYHWPEKFTLDENIRFILYMTERAIKEADRYETGQVCVIYDRANMTKANKDPQLIETAKKLSAMLQDFYAERLGAMYVLHVNWFYKMMYQAVKFLINKKTRKKLHVLGNPQELRRYFDDDQLIAEYGGTDDYIHPYPAD